MKTIIRIEAYTKAAYRVICPARVSANVSYLGVCGLTFSATINQKDYAYLVDAIHHAAQCAGVHRSEYNIILLQTVVKPPLSVFNKKSNKDSSR